MERERVSVEPFITYESEVRYYNRHFNNLFHKAKNDVIYSEDGQEYIDFLAGAGALNYGHNPEFIKKYLLDYINEDGITHGLDMYTKAKQAFVDTFVSKILEPRNLQYKLQFCGPTGTNAVEAALKLARKIKKRNNVFAFMGAFHGMTLGSLAVTSNTSSRAGASVPLNNVTFIPHPGGPIEVDTLQYIRNLLEDDHSGVEKPAAIIFETVQAEGGVNPVSNEWLQGLESLCRQHDILLICDDIQVGCGRTGTFFSFERAGIVPDMVILSKSISGYGLPMSLLLLQREWDVWKPGEHNGTFRGNQLAFVTSTASLHLREELDLDQRVSENERYLQQFLSDNLCAIDQRIKIRGIGMIWGIDLSAFEEIGLTDRIIDDCFHSGLIIENAGRQSHVLKILPPLTISREKLEKGCQILREVLEAYL
nr:diaminobutyrate--2-oxoglutarate transaminase [Bacillus sp. J14TS2]